MELIVGCYTPGDYELVAQEHLLKSVRRLGLLHVIEEIPNRGSWVLNNSACQLYLQSMDQRYPDADMIYCDVDAEIQRDPWGAFHNMKACGYDLGVYYLDGKELLCGTLFLPAGPHRAELLNAWVAMNGQYPDRWDQKNLQTLLEQTPDRFKVHRLPPEYCCIFDLQRKRTPNIVPVIEHFQASRRNKHNVKPVGP